MRLGETLGKVEVGLTKEQLKEVSYASQDKEELMIADDDMCAICQEKLGTVIQDQHVCVLACSHIYCDTCIKTWLKKQSTTALLF